MPFGHRLWLPSERQVLVDLNPDIAAMCAALPHRKQSAIKRKLRRMNLPVTMPRWTDEEKAIARRLYPKMPMSELRKALPRRTASAIKGWVVARSIYKRRVPPAPSGDLLVDQILQRAFELNYTRRELDAIASTKNFYQKNLWRSSGRNSMALGKAVSAMGGRLVAVWDDE
jgi:hypothetical protein